MNKTLRTLGLRVALTVVATTMCVNPARAQVGAPIPSWDQILPAASRFVVLANFGSNAVLDRETGLVWERSPSTTAVTYFTNAELACMGRATGGRRGWRVPSIFEILSLIDPTVPPPGVLLPPGHPFQKVSSASFFWSSTRDSNVTPLMWGANTYDGVVYQYFPTTAGLRVWCVRGPSQASVH